MSIAVNMPEEMLLQYSVDRDILIVMLMLLVIFPIGVKGANKLQLN